MTQDLARHNRAWRAWRALGAAACEVAAAYEESNQPHWVEWARQLERECKEHEDTELKFMGGHVNPLGLSLER